MIQAPLLAAPARKRLAEQLARLTYAEEVLLVGRLLIRIGGRDHHFIDFEVIVEEVEHIAHRLGRVMGEEGGVCRHPKAGGLGSANRRHRLVEHSLAFDGGVMAFLQAIHVNCPREVRARLEIGELALQEDRIGTQIHEALALDQLRGDHVYLRVNQRLAAGDRDHRRTALLNRTDRLLDRHALAQHMLGLLDLAAAGARQVALEQRLELHDQRKLLAAGQALTRQIPTHPRALPYRNRHLGTSLVCRGPIGESPETRSGATEQGVRSLLAHQLFEHRRYSTQR